MDQAYKHMRIQRGFSLIELLIAISVVAIMGGIAMYSWQGYRDNTNLKTAAREVMSDIANCRQRAVAENASYQMNFTNGASTYTITSAAGTITKNLSDFGNGLSFTSGNLLVTFLTRGISSNGTITLTNGKGSTATITINITGRTYVQFALQ
jgi:type IV fimbrial biogenesis protein FimT